MDFGLSSLEDVVPDQASHSDSTASAVEVIAATHKPLGVLADHLLNQFDAAVLAIGCGDGGIAEVKDILRCIEIIKSNAQVQRLDFVYRFAQVVEHSVIGVIEGRIEINHRLLVVLLHCCEHLRDLIGAAVQGRDASKSLQVRATAASNRLEANLAKVI